MRTPQRPWHPLRALLLITILPALLPAQSEKAQITGTIADASGASIPTAEVTATNVATGEKRSVLSGESGMYTVPLLEPGRYEIAVTKQGFRTTSRAGIELHVNQTMRVDFALEVGGVSESVQVTGAAPALQAETSDLGQIVENRQILELPLNGRNTIGLAALSAGVRPQGTFGSNPATGNYTGWGNFSANGGLANANEVLVDGLPVTTSAIGGVAMMPAVDATQEFKVQTNNFSAEFDRTAGGVLNLSLKSGSNALHGSAYEFLRNDKFDAADFFTNRAGRAKPVLRYNQFGASAGGPIRKDKTFFFALYEGFRQHMGRVYTATVPTALEQGGDFSRTMTAAGALRAIYDPATTRRVGDSYVRDPFPGNVIPSNRIDPVAANLVRYLWPAANTTGAAFTNVNNYGTSSNQATNQDTVTGKIDHSFTANHRLSGSYTYIQPSLSFWDPLGNKTTPADDGAEGAERSQNVNLNDSWVINPGTILDLRAGFLRFRDERIPGSYGIDLTQFGFPQSFANQVLFKHIPNIHVGGISDVNASTGSTIFGIQNNYSFAGSLSLIRGAHNMKIGAL
ncbi:MAG TPA: carboxypeptidase-like regulatory domain-containing protein, partial [Bryobacteraceae bacterium]|nr:carboxypeptidase-like regulatory domain-containing protein [Bryobacteraceae bacterium]